ncbi:hypothetical protein, variant [Puccinia triticina 1-1 BBBD Race 1]|uniref:Uncharacterized protein n=1 Tax=Puccinia triticina (isolate 1-1 / race 1 (BBBD)) TaxID=630390 RepID=A0A180GWB5_PUCT1|nr:hypothetical protein PTTG_12072 [Puccinia triticina 1-1 BBBD Race 1]OAV96811.1 hypothetical protein, variant [Puccinia triticina 1-1 BBBD Race 1]WAR63078.1 hypothetical protein PtB15_18B160 [Puccinia triticina]
MTTGTTSSPSYVGGSAATSAKPSASSQATANQSSSKSLPSRELKKVSPRPAKNVTNTTGAGLDDFGRAYVSLIGYLKAVFPSRERKKAGRESSSSKKKKQSGARPTRALELQLQLQQELLRCEWLRDGQVGWRLGPLDLPLRDGDSQPDLKKNLLPGSPLGSIHPPRSRLQTAK